MAKEKRSGIYCIENLITGNKYIGKSVNIDDRMYRSHYDCPALDAAIKKYGNKNFKRYVIEYCTDKDNLFEKEIYYIKELGSHVSNGGYNISFGGEGACGTKQSQEQIEKTRKFMHEFHHVSEEAKERMRILNTGIGNPAFGKKPKNSRSKYFGVAKILDRMTYTYYLSSIIENKNRIRIYFGKNEIDAACAYDKYVIEHNLPRPLNFPEKYGRLK